MPLVSLVIPILADEAAVRQLLAGIPADSRLEVIVSDGGGNPGLDAIAARRADLRVVRSPPGRARQMNAGAAVARGAWLLFLHADSALPDRWIDLLLDALASSAWGAAGPVGGWFQFALDDPAWQARVIERGVRWRVRLFRLPYGDQGLFVRRDVFRALGGFREMPLMEDVEFVRRLVAAGPVVELPARLVTSARRWRRDGWLRRSARNVALLTLYAAGVAPGRLARWYEPGGRP